MVKTWKTDPPPPPDSNESHEPVRKRMYILATDELAVTDLPTTFFYNWADMTAEPEVQADVFRTFQQARVLPILLTGNRKVRTALRGFGFQLGRAKKLEVSELELACRDMLLCFPGSGEGIPRVVFLKCRSCALTESTNNMMSQMMALAELAKRNSAIAQLFFGR